MWISEQILYLLSKSLYNTEVAHTEDQKKSLEKIDAYDAYRSEEIHKIVDALRRYGVQIVNRRVMDFGCNDGAISKHFLNLGVAHVVGVDIDSEAIARAKTLYEDTNLSFVQSTIDSIPIDDKSLDVIISCGVFEHVSDPRAIFAEFKRILIPGGKAIIGTWGWWHPFAPHLWSTMPVPWAHVFFSETTILRVCRRVYQSNWYKPNMHDFDENGNKRSDKYLHTSISKNYLNKYFIKNFERDILSTGLELKTFAVPFGSKYAKWTRVFLTVPWIREFFTGYVWFELTRP